MTLAGYPIVIVPSMATFGSVNDILFANLAEGYTVGQKGDIVFKVSDDYLFNTDEKAYMAVLRYQGAPTNRKVTQVDGIAVGALSTTSGK
jgi:HK97 family phage major capsid protein